MKNIKSTFAIVGDSGLAVTQTDSLRASLLRAGSTRLVVPGDNLYDLDQTYEDVWDIWKKQGFEFTSVALGNHTIGYEAETRYFGIPSEMHAVRDGANLFLNLNSDNEATIELQMQWLDSELTRTEAPFVFIVMHHPPMTITDFHSWEEKRDFQLALRPVLAKFRKKITSLIVGHDHIAGIYSFEGIPMIVSGAGAQVRDALWVESVRGDALYHTQWIFHGEPVWAQLECDEATGGARVNFIRTEDNEVVYSTQVKHPTAPAKRERLADAV